MANASNGGSFIPGASYNATGGTLTSVTLVTPTITTPTITGATVTGTTLTSPTITSPTITGTTTIGDGCTLTTPVLGVAAATSINKVAITAPATSATLTIANGKTLTCNNILTLAGTDSTVMTFPATSATIARTDAANTFTGVQTMTSPALTTPAIGVATGTSLAVTGLLKTSTPSAGFGYATGAGGTATQATDKTTTTAAVPNPSSCGSITMNAATLNAGVIVSFTFTNTAIAATDVLVLNHISGGTVGSYTLNAACGAGSAVIYLRNNTAGNLSEAVVIQYCLVKGVNA